MLPPHRVRALPGQPGHRLLQGRPAAEALPLTEESVAIRRELAAANPDSFRADLALSLYNLAIYCWRSGRRDEALATAEESASIRRELADVNPGLFRADLARTLEALGAWYAESSSGRQRRSQPPSRRSPSAARWLPSPPAAIFPA